LLGIHRETVKKHLESDSFPAYTRKTAKPSILKPYHQVIRDFLDEDDYQATWIFNRLKRMGYTGSYDTLKIFVRSIKEQKCRIAYTRFETEPGLQAQVDWGDFKIVDSSGATTTVYAFVMVLGFSRAMYVEFVERCTMGTFMDCHLQAFRYLRGVPAKILYDNMKHVVVGRENRPLTWSSSISPSTTHSRPGSALRTAHGSRGRASNELLLNPN
jgi:transposase